MPKWITVHKLLLALFILLLFPVVWFAKLLLYFPIESAAAKPAILKKINELGSPFGCREGSRNYQDFGIDTAPTWFIHYSCDTESRVVYEHIVRTLSSKGYIKFVDYTNTSKQGFYVFKYVKVERGYEYEADYQFEPVEKIPNAKVAEVTLSLSRLKEE